MSNAVVTCKLKYNYFKIISAFVDAHQSIMLHLRALYGPVQPCGPVRFSVAATEQVTRSCVHEVSHLSFNAILLLDKLATLRLPVLLILIRCAKNAPRLHINFKVELKNFIFRQNRK